VPCVPLLGVQFLANRSFNAVPPYRDPAEVPHVRRFVLANVVPCIQPGKLQQGRVRWVSVRRLRLPALRGQAVVQAVRRGAPVSAMFREA
jgi:hypothetical protein